MNHALAVHPNLLQDRVLVGLVGAGGSGSQMLSGLARLDAAIRALGHPGLDVIVYDPDDVSEANLGRQLFAPADVGRNKAHVLVTRTNAWFGTDWTSTAARFEQASEGDLGLLISCVDTAKARVAIGHEASAQRALLWLDLGNRADDGQVVLGIPPWNEAHRRYTFRLPTVLELFPELATDKTLDADDAPSCSLAQALERQHLYVNQAVVTPALQILWQIFRFGRLTWHGAFVNLAAGRTTPLPIDRAVRRRMGHDTAYTETGREHTFTPGDWARAYSARYPNDV